jgi:hypothetical protein
VIQQSDRVGTLCFSLSCIREWAAGGWAAEAGDGALYVVVVVVLLSRLMMVVVLIWINPALFSRSPSL